MQEAISPLNVTVATLVMQLGLMGLLSIAAFLLSLGEKYLLHAREDDKSARAGSLYFLILGFLLISLAVLLASEDMYSLSRSLFGGLGIGTIEARTALSLVLGLDLLLVAILVYRTGGSRESPFTPVLLALPALAIFLRESPSRFAGYACVAGIAFSVLFILRGRQEYSLAPYRLLSVLTVWFVGLACLALSMFTGYITRPVPIDQLGGAPAVEAPK